MSGRDRLAGFSLIEVLGVVALISVVFFVALNFYTDLSRASARATEHTRDIRRAAAILDRVARDFEGAMLVVTPPEDDPQGQPWLFVGESLRSESGADHVKFITRNHDPTRTENRESDLAMIAYTTSQDEDGIISLYRWSNPRLPESLEKDFPFADDERSYLVTEDLASFGIQFVDFDGELTDTWDSTTIAQSNTLPSAVEIQLSIASIDREPEIEAPVYRKRTLIPVRPLDLQALLDPNQTGGATGGGNDDNDSDDAPKTVASCVDIHSADTSDDIVRMWADLFPSISDMEWDPSMIQEYPPQIQKLVDPSCR